MNVARFRVNSKNTHPVRFMQDKTAGGQWTDARRSLERRGRVSYQGGRERLWTLMSYRREEKEYR